MAASPVPDQSAKAVEAAEGEQAWPRRSLAWYALLLFVLATMMNFFDLSIFQLMIEMIKKDLQLTDVQVGLLLGPAGVLFYLFVGIPLARLVDIYPRNVIVSIGLFVTSSMTALGGLAQNYTQLFGSRMLVGVGGSAHAPGVFSLLADYFPPKILHRAIAVLQAGFIFGAGFAAILGGWMLGRVAGWEPTQVGPLQIRNWQWVLIFTAIPGLIIAAFILMLPEPPRRGTIAGQKRLSFADVFREIGRRRAVYFPMFIGLAMSAIEAQGVLAWRAPFMMRTYGWDPAQIGAWQGALFFVSSPLGVLLGTWLTEWLGKRHRDAPIRTTAILFGLCTPFAIAMPLMPTGELAMFCAAMSGMFGFGASVPQNTAIQRITPNEMRGQVTAVYLFMFTMFGALGSYVIGAVTQYIVGDEQEMWLSLVIVASILFPAATIAIALAMRPYGREIERLEAASAAP